MRKFPAQSFHHFFPPFFPPHSTSAKLVGTETKKQDELVLFARQVYTLPRTWHAINSCRTVEGVGKLKEKKKKKKLPHANRLKAAVNKKCAALISAQNPRLLLQHNPSDKAEWLLPCKTSPSAQTYRIATMSEAKTTTRARRLAASFLDTALSLLPSLPPVSYKE